tara:strand:+ start:2492 stop:2815 length:324 start_codon:yes stop_codon:yes gene_type:complete
MEHAHVFPSYLVPVEGVVGADPDLEDGLEKAWEQWEKNPLDSAVLVNKTDEFDVSWGTFVDEEPLVRNCANVPLSTKEPEASSGSMAKRKSSGNLSTSNPYIVPCES